MLKHVDIINAFGESDGAARLAIVLNNHGAININRNTTGQWKKRNKIPLGWWPDVVAAAKAHKIKINGKSITLAMIAGAKQGVA